MNIKYLFLMMIVISANCCTLSNNRKNDFIKKNIDKTNKRNISKHGELIIPDFIIKYNSNTENN